MTFSYLLLQALLRDGGPLYTETNLAHIIAEPWNATSAGLFLLIVGYWVVKLRGRYQKHLFLSINLPILAIGGIGGTIYHALRVSDVFLFMDWLPIVILCLAASVYFFARVLNNVWLAVLIVVAALISQFFMFRTNVLPPNVAISVNYVVMGLLILLPTTLLLWKTRFYAGKWVGYALAAFVIAITCRILDYLAILPMGTHFLWHIFGAIACHCMFQYAYEINEQVPSAAQSAI